MSFYFELNFSRGKNKRRLMRAPMPRQKTEIVLKQKDGQEIVLLACTKEQSNHVINSTSGDDEFNNNQCVYKFGFKTITGSQYIASGKSVYQSALKDFIDVPRNSLPSAIWNRAVKDLGSPAFCAIYTRVIKTDDECLE